MQIPFKLISELSFLFFNKVIMEIYMELLSAE